MSSDFNPILLSIAESFETDRLLLRSPLWEDGALLNEAIKESITELREWMPWAVKIPSMEESEINVREARLKFLQRSDLRFHLIQKKTGAFLGCIGLHQIDWHSRKFEIGYWIRTSHSGHGYTTEAVTGLTDYAIKNLQANRIEIRCDSRNQRSANIAKRLGFTLEGILRTDSVGTDGSLRDTMVFSKVSGVEY